MSPEREKIENDSDVSVTLKRQLKDDNGRIICACRGSVKEVFDCFLHTNRFNVAEGDDKHCEMIEYPDGGRAEIDVGYGAAEATYLQWQCAAEGIRAFSAGFSPKQKFIRQEGEEA